MPNFHQWVEFAGIAIEAIGIAVILLGTAIGGVRFVRAWYRAGENPYRQLRQDLGRGILLGLEFLLAADIIRTVALKPDLDNVLVLGLIVLIRTFLSFALEVELYGRWPWEAGAARDGPE